MKLYYTKAACSLVVRIVLNELNIPFEAEAVDLRQKKTASGVDYLAINPKGAVPALQLDNGDLITEVQVILQYLADSSKGQQLLAPVHEMKRYRTLEWLNYISTELHKSLGQLFNPAIPEDLKTTVLIPLVHTRFAFVDKNMTNKEYLMGEHFTLPDAYLFVMLRWAVYFKLDLSPYKQLAAFNKRMAARHSVIESLQQEA